MSGFSASAFINSILGPGQAALRETGGRIERETGFYMTPFALLAGAPGPLVRYRATAEDGSR
jgi:hypothetical protein